MPNHSIMDNIKQMINHLDYENQLDKVRVHIELRRMEIKAENKKRIEKLEKDKKWITILVYCLLHTTSY